ncbi:SDR family oxidoreductase [Candidatus Aerophobetes bacterium]|uniref:SDR family oxidoreductase n=1 Tax=Aerophobetes bacterium TaxID=2030807 RepID=A0A523QH67_UNCAE|nr:MAG: SDR family oxidoreductase [Candidatus Aerophobetes bacterium]
MKFEGKTVIVTGAGRGIGEAYALGFARERANVVVVDVVASRAESTAKKVEGAGGKSLVQAMDVSKKKDVDAMAEKTVERFGRIDALVNNAGVLFQEPFLTSTEEQYYKIYDVNVKGLFLCAQAVARQMIKQKKGKIINVSSIAAIVGQANLSLYSSSKGAVLSLTRAMALELAPHNIQVNAILPGTTETPMAADALANPETRAQLTSGIPLGRLGKPEDHVGAVLYFASEESNWCTGQTLIVDGGYSMV